MASLNYPCSVRQAFNFEKDQQVTVGHLNSIQIGTQALTADITLTLPTNYSATTVVGVIQDWSWNGGYADPIYINFNVSNENQKSLSVMCHTNLSNTAVTVAFNIYCFDQDAKVYYPACSTLTTPLTGFVFKKGGELSLAIDPHNDPLVPSPLNFPAAIGIMPTETSQVINFAVSNTDKFVKQWGVTTAGS